MRLSGGLKCVYKARTSLSGLVFKDHDHYAARKCIAQPRRSDAGNLLLRLAEGCVDSASEVDLLHLFGHFEAVRFDVFPRLAVAPQRGVCRVEVDKADFASLLRWQRREPFHCACDERMRDL